MNTFWINRILNPIERFLTLQVSSGIVLMISAGIALICANTPLYETYMDILHYPVSIGLGENALKMDLHHWVNDGLMVIFFFVVGLEIKKELAVGFLSSRKEAILPFIAALGGMFVPALIYIAFNMSQESIVGWGIPMATDIAFALGVLAFVSKSIPLSLKIFLLALATIDDLGAVLVIASFYSSNISGEWLSFSGMIVFLIFCFKKLHVRNYLTYFILGLALWFTILKSGVHSTVAGVILGLMTPVEPVSSQSNLKEDLKKLIEEKKLNSTYYLEQVKKKLQSLQSPAQMLIDRLHHFVSFGVMPVFAFFNSGLRLGEGFVFSEFLSKPVAYGIFLGLLLGKPIGIFLFSWVAVQMKWAKWPKGVLPIHILGVGFLAGIGFTMALFISSLSFSYDSDIENYSKAAIFLASLMAGVFGYFILFFTKENRVA